MTLTLLALFAPGSVEAEVGRLQQSIFRAHGLVSAVALPPLVPVAFLPPPAPAAHDAGKERRALLPRLNAAVQAPYRISLAGAAWVDGWLYLGVESGGLWQALKAAAGTGESPGLFPVHPGFFLGCAEAKAKQREAIQPSLPAGAFSSSRLAVVELEVDAREGAWWRKVSLEILDEVPLRGRKRA